MLILANSLILIELQLQNHLPSTPAYHKHRPNLPNIPSARYFHVHILY